MRSSYVNNKYTDLPAYQNSIYSFYVYFIFFKFKILTEPNSFEEAIYICCNCSKIRTKKFHLEKILLKMQTTGTRSKIFNEIELKDNHLLNNVT